MNARSSRMVRYFMGIFLLPLLLLGSGGLQMQASAHTAHPGMAPPDKNDCLSLCSNRLNSPEVSLSNREEDKNQEPEPRPSEQYYLQFVGQDTADEHSSSDALLSYLSWRPPDLFKLHENYRI